MNRPTTLVLLAALALSLVVTTTAQSCPTLVLSEPQELMPEDSVRRLKIFFGKYIRVHRDWIIVSSYGHSNYRSACPSGTARAGSLSRCSRPT